MPLAVEVEVELADPGAAGQDRVHLGVGGPLQPGLTDQELPACGFQRVPFLIRAAVTRHYASQPLKGLSRQCPPFTDAACSDDSPAFSVRSYY